MNTKNLDLLSIVIPVFNNAESIQGLLDEIVEVVSSVSPPVELELILVDDGSTDDSWRILSDLAAIDFVFPR